MAGLVLVWGGVFDHPGLLGGEGVLQYNYVGWSWLGQNVRPSCLN